MRTKSRLCWCLVLFGYSVLSCALASTLTAKPRKVVILAGKKSHGPEGNRIHDYPWSARLLKVALDNSNVANQLAVEFHLNGWPRDVDTLSDADTIMVISDGRDGDKYEEAPHFQNDRRAGIIQRQIKRGCGFITFHFSTFAPDKYARQILDWSGGYFDWEDNGERKWYSAIQTLEADVQIGAANHPVARGLKPFRMREEFYYNIRFHPANNSFDPILVVPSLNGRDSHGNVVAWARQRDDGGRGFGTTCGHFYDNWMNDDFRTMILNAIAWTAGLEVPNGGVRAPFFDRDQISAALTEVTGVQPATIKPSIKAIIVTGHQHPAHMWRETTLALQDAYRRDRRLQVTSIPDPEFLADPKLHDYDAIVLNYCNWQQPAGISDQAKDNFVNYLNAGGGLVLIHFSNGAFHFSLPGAEQSDWPEYRQICRRVWNHRKPDDGSIATGHDAYGRFRVNIVDTRHPITSELSAFETIDELYFAQDGDAPIHVLATARSKVTKRDEPMAFVYQYGEGRIFQMVLGHAAESLRTDTAKLVLRGTIWAAGRKQEVSAD